MPTIQFLTHPTACLSVLDEVSLVLSGGCRWIQLRMKDSPDSDVVSVGRAAACLCHEYGAVLIVDDRVHLCRTIGADGVHLGRRDMPVSEARAILGTRAIIGATVNTPADLVHAVSSGADYAGCGPFRFTTTKSHLSPLLGIAGYRRLVAARNRQRRHIPLVAIGGITRSDIPSLMSTGIDGIALSGSVVRADDPAEEMRLLCAAMNEWQCSHPAATPDSVASSAAVPPSVNNKTNDQ